MFEFYHPRVLFLLLGLPLLLWRARSPGARAGARWSSLAVVAGGRSWRTLLAWIPSALGLLGLASLVVALARPQTEDRQVITGEGVDIMVALDMSGSMNAVDLSEEDLEDLLRQAAAFAAAGGLDG